MSDDELVTWKDALEHEAKTYARLQQEIKDGQRAEAVHANGDELVTMPLADLRHIEAALKLCESHHKSDATVREVALDALIVLRKAWAVAAQVPAYESQTVTRP